MGSSSRDIRLTDTVYVNSEKRLPVHFDLNSHLGDIAQFPEGRAMIAELYSGGNAVGNFDDDDDNMRRVNEAMMSELPLRAMVSFSPDPLITRERISMFLDRLNENLSR